MGKSAAIFNINGGNRISSLSEFRFTLNDGLRVKLVFEKYVTRFILLADYPKFGFLHSITILANS
ncbi:hypothetical protein EGI24_13805 [Lacihabitans sp. CS3-21]|nr:hypothetical protein [Lacihabitans sp. CS3-21]